MSNISLQELYSSSVTSLLVDKGFDVIGLTAYLWDPGSCGNKADAAAPGHAAVFTGKTT